MVSQIIKEIQLQNGLTEKDFRSFPDEFEMFHHLRNISNSNQTYTGKIKK
jgi:hypothetical protein